MFNLDFYKRFCKIALLSQRMCRSKASDYLSKCLSVTGIAFSLDTRNAGTYPTLIQTCGKLSTYTTGLWHQIGQLSDKALISQKKNKLVWFSLNTQDECFHSHSEKFGHGYKARGNLRQFIWKSYFRSTAGIYTFTHSQPYFQNLFWH